MPYPLVSFIILDGSQVPQQPPKTISIRSAIINKLVKIFVPAELSEAFTPCDGSAVGHGFVEQMGVYTMRLPS